MEASECMCGYWGVQGAERAGQARRGPPLLCTRGAPVHLGFRRVLPRGFASVSRCARPACPVPATCSLAARRSSLAARLLTTVTATRSTRIDSIVKNTNYFTIYDVFPLFFNFLINNIFKFIIR